MAMGGILGVAAWTHKQRGYSNYSGNFLEEQQNVNPINDTDDSPTSFTPPAAHSPIVKAKIIPPQG